MASPLVVFDSSAVITWATGRYGVAQIEAILKTRNTQVYLHRHNATEVWYQVHRAAALEKFLQANGDRVKPGSSPDLTGVDMNDTTMFESEKGRQTANLLFNRIEDAGVKIVGDETFPNLWKQAAEIKSQYRRVSLADCFGVSLAKALNAPFWSSDRHELEALVTAGVVQVQFFR